MTTIQNMNTYRVMSHVGVTDVSLGESLTSAKALLFGHLADLAWPVVEHYRSDLYHDVRWVDEHITLDNWKDGFTFTFGVRRRGTCIGLDQQLILDFSDHTYEVYVFIDRTVLTANWMVRIHEVLA